MFLKAWRALACALIFITMISGVPIRTASTVEQVSLIQEGKTSKNLDVASLRADECIPGMDASQNNAMINRFCGSWIAVFSDSQGHLQRCPKPCYDALMFYSRSCSFRALPGQMQQHMTTYLNACGSTIKEVTAAPTAAPTELPTAEPTVTPTEEPTTLSPTTDEPSFAPTATPTEEPSFAPTETPTEMPTEEPTSSPTQEPTSSPTQEPTSSPTSTPTTLCPPADVVLIMDSSGSISESDWAKFKKFTGLIVNKLPISKEGMHVGIVDYSDKAKLVSSLVGDRATLHDKAKLGLSIATAGHTYTDKAVNLAVQHLRTARPAVPKLAIVLTDGLPTNRTLAGAAFAAAKEEGVEVQMVTVGEVLSLVPMSPEWSAKGYPPLKMTGGFEQLLQRIDTVAGTICQMSSSFGANTEPEAPTEGPVLSLTLPPVTPGTHAPTVIPDSNKKCDTDNDCSDLPTYTACGSNQAGCHCVPPRMVETGASRQCGAITTQFAVAEDVKSVVTEKKAQEAFIAVEEALINECEKQPIPFEKDCFQQWTDCSWAPPFNIRVCSNAMRECDKLNNKIKAWKQDKSLIPCKNETAVTSAATPGPLEPALPIDVTLAPVAWTEITGELNSWDELGDAKFDIPAEWNDIPDDPSFWELDFESPPLDDFGVAESLQTAAKSALRSSPTVQIINGGRIKLDATCHKIYATSKFHKWILGLAGGKRGRIFPRGDWSYRLVKGLAGDNTISIMDCATGNYMRHSGHWMWSAPRESSALFKRDASFFLVKTSTGYNLRSENFPHMNIRHQNYWTKLSTASDVSPAYDDNWKFVPPLPEVLTKSAFRTWWTPYRGGAGGAPVTSFCPNGQFISYWRIRSGALVDSIQGRCSGGKWLRKCGGNGGRASVKKTRSRDLSVRTGNLVDQFMARGGNGGKVSTLSCGTGQISGYSLRCGTLVDGVKLMCTK